MAITIRNRFWRWSMAVPFAEAPLIRFWHSLILLSGMIGTGLLAVHLGRDLNWDLFNYHFYNGWAAWTGHIWSNSVPAAVQTFLNPVLDIPQYLLLSHLPPRFAMFVLGAFQGIGFYLLFVIALRVLPRRQGSSRVVLALAAALAGMAGPVTFSEFGNTMGDLTLSVLLLGAVVLALQALEHEDRGAIAKKLLLAGFCLGLAAGAKYTMVICLFPAFGALLIRPPWGMKRLPALACLVGGSLLGLLAIAGPWMLMLYAHYASPVFPGFNEVFHSPLAAAATGPLKDGRWFANGLQDWLLLPFSMLEYGKHHMEVPFRAIRYALVFVLLGILVLWCLGRRILRPGRAGPTPSADRRWSAAGVWLLLFWLASYACWLHVFGYYRYLTPMEMLAPLVILVCLQRFSGSGKRTATIFVVLVLAMVSFMSVGSWGRGGYEVSNYFEVKLPPSYVQPHAMVLMTSYKTTSFVVPYFPEGNRFVRLQSGADPVLSQFYRQKQAQRIKAYTGAFFLLTVTNKIDEAVPILRKYQLKLVEGSCLPVPASYGLKISLCRVERRP